MDPPNGPARMQQLPHIYTVQYNRQQVQDSVLTTAKI